MSVLRRWIAAISVACSVLLASTTFAGPPEAITTRFIRLGAEQGLPPEINALEVDNQGYLWAATSDGLAQYDGSGFRFWRRAVGLQGALPDNELATLARTSDDRLWIASANHLSVMDQERRGFVQIKFVGATSACARDIVALAPSSDGGVWIGSYSGSVCRVARDGRVSIRLSPAVGVGVPAIPNVMRGVRDGGLLVGTERGLYLLKDDGLREIAPAQLGDANVFNLSADDDETLWVGTDRGLFQFDAHGEVRPARWKLPPLANNASVSRDHRGEYWIGTSIGLFHAASRTSPVVAVSDVGPDDGLSSGVFVQVEDHEGGMWLASYSQGLSYLPPGRGRFTAISAIDGAAMHHIDPVAAVEDGAGGFWVAASRGLYALPAGSRRPRLRASSNGLGTTWLLSVSRCRDGMLWLAGYDSVIAFNPASGRVVHRLHFPDDGARTVQRVLCVGDGEAWVSLYGGDISVHARDGRTLRLLPAEVTIGARGQDFAAPVVGPDGVPWLSDGQRLLRWNGQGFDGISLAGGEPVQAFAFADVRSVWVSRFGVLEHYALEDGVATLRRRYDGDAGISAASMQKILPTSHGQLWLATSRGLMQFDSRQSRARLFGMRDGLPGLDFSIETPRRGAGGLALAMAKEGLVLFDPDRPLPPASTPALAIESLELRRDEDLIALPSRRTGKLTATMLPGDRDLRVVARLMSFSDPAAHRYRFFLRGFDTDWVLQNERGERVFSTLPAGRFHLEIQGAGVDGVWSPSRHIALTVLAPWWQRWWAVLLYALALSGLLWWIAYLDRLRLQRRHAYQLAKQRQQLAEQTSLAKSRFLANLGHEVRTPMTGVLGMSELLLTSRLDDRQHSQVQSIRRAGEHLLGLVNDALDLTRIEAGKLELQHIDFDLHALVDDAVALMWPLAERKSLKFSTQIEHGLARVWCGDPTRLRQILLNLLGNAIKFTARGEVCLRVEVIAAQGFRIVVTDTGPGLDAEQQRRLFRRFEQAEGAQTASRYGGSGLGLAICQELAVAMGGGIELRSAPGEGACFIVRLPLEPAAVGSVSLREISIANAATACDVLLVEDDAIVADVLLGLLRAQGHRATHTAHALAAMSECATHRFDIALIDLDLPGMDGLTLAQHLRAQGFDRPMIAVTARADADAEPQAIAAGFDAFVRKPLTGEMLADAIAHHIQMVAPG